MLGDKTLVLSNQTKIGVVGLGYVGLPLAVELTKHFDTTGYDISETRITALRNHIDETGEVESHILASLSPNTFTSHALDLKDCSVYIVTVPTPIDEHKKPDLSPLLAASKFVGEQLEPGNVVVFESTVYPGATEEDCVPILEKYSKLKFNKGFFVGYSPERINPGDRERRLPNITKITSGSTATAADFIDQLYNTIIEAGTYKAPSIKVAEAAKVIENTQRDLNIALMNELAIIFNKMNIDTEAVLKAASTKWNFLPFKPGLVGGHCIGVDPYYLTHKAQEIGYHPQVVLAGRRLNDGMGAYVGSKFIKALLLKGINPATSKVLVMGLTFKENCPDLRNTRIVDIILELEEYGVLVEVYDPWLDPSDRMLASINYISEPSSNTYDGSIIAVSHDAFRDLGIEKIKSFMRPLSVIYDLKSLFPKDSSDLRL